MNKKLVLVILLVLVVLSSFMTTACNDDTVRIELPSNGCNVTACTNDNSDGGIYINGKNIAPKQ